MIIPVIVTGAIAELDLPISTVLFHGNVEPSQMVWDVGDATGDDSTLPYAALHTKFFVHPEIAKRYGLRTPVKAYSGDLVM